MTTLEERHRHVRRRVWKIHGVSLVALLAILAWYGFRLFFCWGSNIGLLRVNLCRVAFGAPVAVLILVAVLVWYLAADLMEFGSEVARSYL